MMTRLSRLTVTDSERTTAETTTTTTTHRQVIMTISRTSSTTASTKIRSRIDRICLFSFAVVGIFFATATRHVDGFSLGPRVSSSRSPISPSSLSASSSATSSSVTPDGEKGVAIICGATGYIGKSCVRESVRQGYYTVALVRDANKVQNTADGRRLYGDFFEGAHVVQCDVSDPRQLTEAFHAIQRETDGRPIDAIVSCLASRSGIKREAFEIDYQATLNCMKAGTDFGARHFVLLSAICVRKPLLQFQLAKLQFEQELQRQSAMTYSIVRPTAFFKSVSGQLERLQQGKPFLMFQASTRANPIAESDLATYIIDCISKPDRWNQILNLGGPDLPLTKQEQGEMLFDAIGKPPTFSNIPVWIFDVSINILQSLADFFRNEQLENAAELGRIGKYYAVEDMVEETNRYGTISLREHFNRIASEGQEYDPYTTMTGILGLLKKDDKNVETNIDNTLVAAPSGTAPKDIKVIDVVPKSLALSNVTSVV